jgi:hypothetical protein
MIGCRDDKLCKAPSKLHMVATRCCYVVVVVVVVVVIVALCHTGFWWIMDTVDLR